VQVASDIDKEKTPQPPIAAAPPSSPQPTAPSPEAALSAGRKVAMVIGNSAYKYMPSLRNPSNDAGDVGKALNELGFDTIVATDLDRIGMKDATGPFSRRDGNADIALVYYARAGMQHTGRNYLLPIESKVKGRAAAHAFR